MAVPRRSVLLLVALLLAVGLLATPRVGAGEAGAPSPTTPAPDPGWQVSAPRPGLDHPVPGDPIDLGVRQRYAAPSDQTVVQVEVADAQAVVTSTLLTVAGDAWTFLVYPDDFPGASPTHAGTYQVLYRVDTQTIVTDSFVIAEGTMVLADPT